MISRPGLPMPPSLWAATSTAAPDTPALTQSVSTDVAVVGGGYTGLSAALHLAERGASVRLLEAAEPGWGASGRNGGQVNPSLKHDPDVIEAMLGRKQGERLNEAIHDSADDVFGLIARHHIDCSPVRKGWLQLAHTPAAVPHLHNRAEQFRRRGVAAQALDAADTALRVGSNAFPGAWLDPRAGSIHPLAYARGMAKAAQSAGARIHGNTLVTGLRRSGSQWQLSTRVAGSTCNDVSVTADRVVIATNGYTGGLWPGLQQTVLAANSLIVATEPLGSTASTVLPGGETAATAQRLLLYFRRDEAGRLLIGGRGQFAEPSSSAHFEHLRRSARIIFPQLDAVRFQYHWSGRVAITQDFMPHVHEAGPGLVIALGYNGRGIATATAMGKHIAGWLCGDKGFPFPLSPIRPIPMHFLQRIYIGGGVAWYSLLDRLARLKAKHVGGSLP